METIQHILEEEAQNLKKIVKDAKKRLCGAPQGHLRIVKKREGIEFYYKEDKGQRNGRYMRKHEHEMARAIAQRDYDTQLVRRGEARINAIDTFLKKYNKTSLHDIYRKTNPNRRRMIQDMIISDEEYINQWQKVLYKGKDFEEEKTPIITERGELVRSKSEKIIADKLYMLGIPYRYEYPLLLQGNIKLHPDFTILKMPERKEVYLEHLGLMDDMDYVEGVMRKLNIYERNEIYLGVNLFITYETKKNPLNTRTLDGIIKKLFCEDIG